MFDALERDHLSSRRRETPEDRCPAARFFAARPSSERVLTFRHINKGLVWHREDEQAEGSGFCEKT